MKGRHSILGPSSKAERRRYSEQSSGRRGMDNTKGDSGFEPSFVYKEQVQHQQLGEASSRRAITEGGSNNEPALGLQGTRASSAAKGSQQQETITEGDSNDEPFLQEPGAAPAAKGSQWQEGQQ